MGLTDWGSYQGFGFVVFMHINHLMLGMKDSDCLPQFAGVTSTQQAPSLLWCDDAPR